MTGVPKIHVLQLDIESPTRVKKLEGRLLKVDLEGLAITLFFTFKHGVVRVRLDAEAKPDTVISGTPVTPAHGGFQTWACPFQPVRCHRPDIQLQQFRLVRRV